MSCRDGYERITEKNKSIYIYIWDKMELLQETKPFFPGTASLIENLDRKYIYIYIYIYYNI